MSDRSAFITAICADPDDDTARLVYADYLEENGEPARAEFIRVQCELAKLGEPPRVIPIDSRSWEPVGVGQPDGAFLRHDDSGFAVNDVLELEVGFVDTGSTLRFFAAVTGVILGNPGGQRVRYRTLPGDPFPERARYIDLRRRERELLSAHAVEWLGNLPPLRPDALMYGPSNRDLTFDRVVWVEGSADTIAAMNSAVAADREADRAAAHALEQLRDEYARTRGDDDD